MLDRLEELRRQRALVAEHLAWLDQVIAASAPVQPPAAPPLPTVASLPAAATTAPATHRPPAPPVPTAQPEQAAPEGKPTVAVAATPVAADDHAHLLPEIKPAAIKDDVRRGCLLYFFLAAVLVIGGGALLVWAARAYNKKHPPKPRVEQTDQY